MKLIICYALRDDLGNYTDVKGCWKEKGKLVYHSEKSHRDVGKTRFKDELEVFRDQMEQKLHKAGIMRYLTVVELVLE